MKKEKVTTEMLRELGIEEYAKTYQLTKKFLKRFRKYYDAVLEYKQYTDNGENLIQDLEYELEASQTEDEKVNIQGVDTEMQDHIRDLNERLNQARKELDEYLNTLPGVGSPIDKEESKEAYSTIELQFAGKAIPYQDIVEKARELSGEKDVMIYIKPEENRVYYVDGDISGSFEI